MVNNLEYDALITIKFQIRRITKNKRTIIILYSMFWREIAFHFDWQSMDNSFEEKQIHIEVRHQLARKKSFCFSNFLCKF